MLQGYHNIDKEIFLSLPSCIGEEGVIYVVKQQLSEQENEMLQKSANLIDEIQKNIKF